MTAPQSPFYDSSADATLAAVTGASGAIYAAIVENTDATDTVYLQLFSAPDAVPGTTTPAFVIPAEPGVSGYYFAKLKIGVTGVYYAVTSTPTGGSNPPSTVRVSLTYG